MSDEGGKEGMWSSLVAILKSFGLGGALILIGFGIVMLAIFKGPDFKPESAQPAVLWIGLGAGGLAIVIGLILLRLGPSINSTGIKRVSRYDVYIAAPMAGFGNDDEGRRTAVDLVRCIEGALLRLPDVRNVYTPVAARSQSAQYETPGTAFDTELTALRSAKRYLLVLPGALPAGTSVLVTAGIAIALKLPCAILAHKDLALPYLLDGAVQSRAVQLRQHRYTDAENIEKLFANNGLRLFGSE